MNNPYRDLPISGSIKPIFTLTGVICLLTFFASLTGILVRKSVYPTQELVETFVANDVSNLVIGLPALIGSVIAIRKGSLIGLLSLPGAWLYILYNYLVYSLSMPFNNNYPVYPVLVILSITSIVIYLRMLSSKSIKLYLDSSISVKLVGGFLIGLGSLFFIRAASIVISDVANHSGLPRTELALNIADLMITPLWIIVGILLWRRHAIGFSLGVTVLFQANSLFLGLILFLLLQPSLSSTAINITDLLGIIIMALVALFPFVLFLIGINKRKNRTF